MQVWITNGADLAWLIDPSRKAVEIYRSGRPPEIIEGASRVIGDSPVENFLPELDRLWG